MEKMTFSSLELDSNLLITKCNVNYTNQVKTISEQQLISEHLAKVLGVDSDDLSNLFTSLTSHQPQPLLLFSNQCSLSRNNLNNMFIYYLLVIKHNGGYLVHSTNWLTYLHNLNRSLNINYDNLTQLNSLINRHESFVNLSPIAVFKALYPLILHVPNKFSHKINGANVYDITRAFVSKSNDDLFTKDYAQNIFSRLRTAIKHEFKYPSADINEFVQSEEPCVIKYHGEICVPNTTLKQGLIFRVRSDEFLDYLITSANKPVIT